MPINGESPERWTDRGVRPLFSVIVPVYNHERYIGAALDSLLAQTDPDWEAVVVNDGSTDGTSGVLARYARLDPRIAAYEKPNGGVSSALNLGLSKARGTWVCWLSSDDLFEPTKLGVHREAFRAHPAVRFFFTLHRILDHETGRVTDAPLWRNIPDPDVEALEMLRCTFVHGNSICVRRDCFDVVGGFDEALSYGQDYDMWLRLAVQTPAVFLPVHTCITRVHPGQGTQGFPEAGFYDSAVSGITLLNRCTLATLVRGAALSEARVAHRLVECALQVAGNPGSFLYKLGGHPALLGRIVEWMVNECPPALRRSMAGLFEAHASRVLPGLEGTWLGLYWKMARACLRARPARYTYAGVDAQDHGRAEYWHAAARGLPHAEPVRRYLARAFGREPGAAVVPAAPSTLGDVAFVAPANSDVASPVAYGTARATREMAGYLMRAGQPVLIAGKAGTPVGWVEAVPFLGARDEAELSRLLWGLGRIGCAIGVSRADVAGTVAARRHAVYQHNSSAPQGGLPPWLINAAGLRVICVSEFARTMQVGHGIRPSRLSVVKNGIDVARFSLAPEVPRAAHRLVFAGALVDYKGFDLALAAVRQLRAAHGDVEFHVYGRNVPWEGPMDHLASAWLDADRRFAFPAIAADLPGVVYHGEVDAPAMAAAFRQGELLLAPSRITETFGLAALEAQACGCIPVVPDAGAFGEVLGGDAERVLYAPNTAEALAGAVLALWSRGRPDAAMQQAASLHACRWSWTDAAAQFMDCLERDGRAARWRQPAFMLAALFGQYDRSLLKRRIHWRRHLWRQGRAMP